MEHGKSNFGVVKWNLVEHCLALLNYYRWSTFFFCFPLTITAWAIQWQSEQIKESKPSPFDQFKLHSFDFFRLHYSNALFSIGSFTTTKTPKQLSARWLLTRKKLWCFPLKINEAKKSSTLSKHRRINHFENAYSEDFSNRRWTENYSVPKASAVCFINYSNLLVIMTSFMGFVWENFPSWIQMICDRDFRWLYWKRRGNSYQMSCCCFYFCHWRCRCHNNECYHIKCEVVNRRDPCYTQTNALHRKDTFEKFQTTQLIVLIWSFLYKTEPFSLKMLFHR